MMTLRHIVAQVCTVDGILKDLYSIADIAARMSASAILVIAAGFLLVINAVYINFALGREDFLTEAVLFWNRQKISGLAKYLANQYSKVSDTFVEPRNQMFPDQCSPLYL